MKKVKFLYDKVMEITGQVGKDHVGAYAAQAAYFFMLSLIPIILLLITLVQYTPVTKADVMTAVLQVFPKSVDSLITSIVNQVYNQSGGIISLTIIVALWSAGKGVLALTTGLNCVYDCKETRNYIILRIRATFYTVAFIIVIIFLLVLSVFGNTLNLFVTEHYPLMERLVDQIMQIRGIITPVLLFVFTMMIYKFLPNHIVQLKVQLMGAAFSAVGWMIVSWIFSVYLDIFKGFSSMYGSLTTIVLIMLWLYFCMYILLLGGEVNVILREMEQELIANLRRSRFVLALDVTDVKGALDLTKPNPDVKVPYLKNSTGDIIQPIFSDLWEFEKFRQKNPRKLQALSAPFQKLVPPLIQNAKGFALNPAGFNLLLQRDKVEALAKQQ